jgi:hypothetical protein
MMRRNQGFECVWNSCSDSCKQCGLRPRLRLTPYSLRFATAFGRI